MGKRGPRPHPTKLRMLHGEHRPSHLNQHEPQPRPELPECPPGASDEVREVWDETLRQLDDMDVAKAADRDALYAYCEHVVTHRQASRMLARSGLLIEGSTGSYVRNPLAQVQRDAAQGIRQFAAEFGLSPSARTRIETNTKDSGADEDNPFSGAG